MIMQEFFVILEMSMAHMPRAGQSQVDMHTWKNWGSEVKEAEQGRVLSAR